MAGMIPVKLQPTGGSRRFSVDNNGDVQAFYRIGERLGKGAFGSVRKVVSLRTQEAFAMKTVPKERHKLIARTDTARRSVNAEYARQLDREIALMKSMDHSNIVRLWETFEDEDRVFFIMDLCEGGELLDFIVETERFSEAQAVIVMRQVFSAVGYMHELNVVHRDMKLANCLFRTRDPIEANVLKIIDFGLSIQISEDQALRAQQGTPYFMAPQVLKGTAYDSAADMWSCGVMLYVLLCGYPPFGGNTAPAVIAKVTHGNFSFSDADWACVSEEARIFIRGLLKMQPRDRLTAKQALEHRWLRVGETRDEELPYSVINNLQNFSAQWRSKRSADKERRRQASKTVAEQEADSAIRILPRSDDILGLVQRWIPAHFLCCSDSGNGLHQVKKKGMGLSEIVEVVDHTNKIDCAGAVRGFELDRFRVVEQTSFLSPGAEAVIGSVFRPPRVAEETRGSCG